MDKAPGPDGFNVHFFKKAWHVVHTDVVAAIRSFFLSRRLLGEVYATVLSLIPKCPNPSKMGDFRPISCCNIVYKCITTIIANRFEPCLNSIVG